MKIEIDISDFWLEEGELETELKRYITHQAVNAINASIKERVEKHVDAEAKRQIEESMYKLINSHITECIASEKVKNPYNSSEQITLTEWITGRFEKSDNTAKLNDVVSKVAKNYADEIKQRYDMLFASQLVSKMHENKMLKDDVANMLLDNKTGG